MKAALALIIVLSHHGYWFGGQEQTITAQWPVAATMPAADLHWDLLLGQIAIASGQIPLPADGSPATIRLQLPTARARTLLRWEYHLAARGGSDELATGGAPVHLFPPIQTADLAAAVENKKLYVLDDPDGLPAALTAAKIKFTPLQTFTDLQLQRADIILIGPDQLPESPFPQSALQAQAQAGAQVLILSQRQTRTVCGYNVGRRPAAPTLAWRYDHPLFDQLDADDWKSCLCEGEPDLRPIQLPADEPALELAYWPPEIPTPAPVPIDALIAVKAVGAGRIVLCQLPFADWTTDPRSRFFLYNALNYLCTRPEPTPRPSERPTTRPTAPVAMPTINISPEGQP